MSGDDELRRRLRDIPAPRAGLDADAVIARAKGKRRPKTIALSSAATVAGVLIVAPLVVPGLQVLPQSASTVSTDAGGAATDSATEPAPGAESGASPESATGTEEAGTEEDGTGETGATDAGAGDTGASGGEALCGLPRAGDVGLVLAFVGRGTDAPALVRASGGEAVRITAVEVASLEVVDGVARAAAGAASEEVTLAPGETAELPVTSAVLEADACGDGTPSAPVPVAIVGVNGAQPIAVVGVPAE